MGGKEPVRKCVGCNEMKSKKDLMRVLRQADGTVFLDITGKANGRGAYLCRNQECLRRAWRTKGLQRSLKTAIPQEILDGLEQEMMNIVTG